MKADIQEFIKIPSKLDDHGNLRLWRKHFSTLLQDDEDPNIAFRDVVPNPIDNDGLEISRPSYKSKSGLCALKIIKRQVLMASLLNYLSPDAMSW